MSSTTETPKLTEAQKRAILKAAARPHGKHSLQSKPKALKAAGKDHGKRALIIKFFSL